ncbi:hypothetical protein Moror_11364 [Moniliophthora roreri MCA 2997]|nr:hypothetical protein Moror_11364 [Moniliophthora roreri MCA 2997]
MSSSTPGTPPLESDISIDSTSVRRSILRASVFDAFLQLGGLDENSQIADWMFSEQQPDSMGSGSNSNHKDQIDWGPSSPYRFREKSGSRFRERLDSDAPDFMLHASIWDDDENPKNSLSQAPIKPKQSDRVQSATQNSRSMAGRRSALKFAANIPEPRNPTRKTFFLFRSRTARHPRASKVPEKTLGVEDSEDDSSPSSSPPTKNRRLSLFRTKTHPPPTIVAAPDFVDSPLSPASITSDWERVDPLSTIDFQTLTNTDNPFLHGNGHQRPSHSKEDAGNPQVPFPGVDSPSRASSESDNQYSHSSTLMQRLSVVVTRPFQRYSHHHHVGERQRSPSESESSPSKSIRQGPVFPPLRRTQSNTVPDTSTHRGFLMSVPSAPTYATSQMIPLTNSMSHS